MNTFQCVDEGLSGRGREIEDYGEGRRPRGVRSSPRGSLGDRVAVIGVTLNVREKPLKVVLKFYL